VGQTILLRIPTWARGHATGCNTWLLAAKRVWEEGGMGKGGGNEGATSKGEEGE